LAFFAQASPKKLQTYCPYGCIECDLGIIDSIEVELVQLGGVVSEKAVVSQSGIMPRDVEETCLQASCFLKCRWENSLENV